MSIKQNLKIAANLFQAEMPHYVIFFVTAECNSRCPHCFYWESIEKFDKPQELTVEEIRKVANNFRNLEQLSIGGGEPFLRRELADICEIWAKTSSVSFLTIPTNGILTDRIQSTVEDILTRCPGVHLRMVVSLDGVGALHDKLRGVAGNFEKAMRTFSGLASLREKYRNLSLDVSTVIQKGNEEKIVEIFEWVAGNLDADNHSLLYPRGRPRDPETARVSLENYRRAHRFVERATGKKESRPLSAFLRAVTELSREVVAQTVEQKRMVLPCKAGKRFIVIGEQGDVFPCEILGESFGNVRDFDYNVRKILRTELADRLMQCIRDKECHCTFECAVNTNVIFSPSLYPRILMKMVRTAIGF